MNSTVKKERRTFDLATAALEHLELLNREDQNPLEVAARFRTLLRSRKDPPPVDEECPPPIDTNRVSYPVVNWKYLRRKRYEQKFQQYILTKFHPRPPQKRYSLRSPSPSIRTPCISPIHFPRMNYTVSSFHGTVDDFLFSIADCNLLIRCQPEKLF